MAIGDKENYLARGDSVSPGGGPREDVVGSTQLMSAGRFDQILTTQSALNLFAASAWVGGGAPTANVASHLLTPLRVVNGAGSTLTLEWPTDPSNYDVNRSSGYICGWCSARSGAPPSGFTFRLADITAADIPFEDDAAQNYNVGIAVSHVPARAEQNPRTGLYEFVEELAVIGYDFAPASVIYNATLDETTLVFPNSRFVGGDAAAPHTLAGRTAMAWKVDPLGETAVAIDVGTVTFTADNRLVVSGSFGQDPASVSTTAADYAICLLGPVVYAATAGGGDSGSADPGIAHVAYGRVSGGGSWDHTGQNRLPHANLLIETVIGMTDPDLLPEKVSRPTISVRPSDAFPVGTPLLSVYDDEAASTALFEVRKGGGIGGSVVGRYDSLANFIATSEPPDVGIVDASDYTTLPLDLVASEPAQDGICYHCHSDGQYLFTAEGDETAPNLVFRAYNIEEFSTEGFIATVSVNTSVGGAGTPTFVAFGSDGTHLAIAINDGTAWGVRLYSWDASTLSFTNEWFYQASGPINDIALSNGGVYIAVQNAGASTMLRVNYAAATGGATIAAGGATWAFVYDATANPTAVCVGGGYVIFCGQDTGGGGGDQIRVFLDDATGTLFDTKDLGGGGASTSVLNRMADTDGLYLYVFADNAGTEEFFRVPFRGGVSAISPSLGAIAGFSPSTNKGHMVVDDRFIFWFDTLNKTLRVAEKSFDGTQSDITISTVDPAKYGIVDFFDVASDGTRLFFGCVDATDAIVMVNRPSSEPKTYRRNLLTDKATAYKQAAQPIESF